MKKPKNKRNPRRSTSPVLRRQMRRRSAFFFAAFAGLWLPKPFAAVLVDLDATSLAEGARASWTNTGTLGGVFVPSGGTAAAPIVGTVGGTTAMQFDGGDFLMVCSTTQ